MPYLPAYSPAIVLPGADYNWFTNDLLQVGADAFIVAAIDTSLEQADAVLFNTAPEVINSAAIVSANSNTSRVYLTYQSDYDNVAGALSANVGGFGQVRSRTFTPLLSPLEAPQQEPILDPASTRSATLRGAAPWLNFLTAEHIAGVAWIGAGSSLDMSGPVNYWPSLPPQILCVRVPQDEPASVMLACRDDPGATTTPLLFDNVSGCEIGAQNDEGGILACYTATFNVSPELPGNGFYAVCMPRTGLSAFAPLQLSNTIFNYSACVRRSDGKALVSSYVASGNDQGYAPGIWLVTMEPSELTAVASGELTMPDGLSNPGWDCPPAPTPDGGFFCMIEGAEGTTVCRYDAAFNLVRSSFFNIDGFAPQRIVALDNDRAMILGGAFDPDTFATLGMSITVAQWVDDATVTIERSFAVINLGLCVPCAPVLFDADGNWRR
jgi:hypothetical protein